MHDSKKKEIVGIFLYFIVISLIVGFFKIEYLQSMFLFAGIPSIYITCKSKNIFRKTFFFSIIFTAPLTMIINYMGTISGAWHEITTIDLLFFNVFPAESFIWAIIIVYFIIAFYEYFFDKDKDKSTFSKNIVYLIYFLFAAVCVFWIIWSIYKEILIIEYFYIYFVLLFFVLPTVLVLWKHPRLFKKIIYQSLFFFLLGIIYEISALYAGHWIFPGNYIGLVSFLKFEVPIEAFFWLLFWVPAIISIYEVTADDTK